MSSEAGAPAPADRIAGAEPVATAPVPFVLAYAAVVLALVVLPVVVPAPLVDPDEGLHAAISQEMVASGDYVVPRFLGEPFLDKPILFFWTQAAAFRLAGENEAAARLPGLFFGVLGALTTGWLAATVLGGRLGWLASLFYGTMLVPMALAEVPVHDVALVPFTNTALLAFWRASRATRIGRTVAWSLAAGAALGLAMLTKGLSGVAIVGLAHATLLVVERRVSIVIVAAGILALLVGVAIAAPWYLAMERQHAGYLHYYFVERHLSGFATETQRHGGRPWTYYLPVLVAGGLPWTIYVPLAVRRPRPSSDRGTYDAPAARRLGWIWLLSGWLFLSVAGSKLFTYALPLFPALALLATIPWVDALARGPRGRSFHRCVALHAVCGALLLPIAMVAAWRITTTVPSWWAYASSAVLVIAWFAAWRSWQRHRVVEGATTAMLATAAALAVVVGAVLPAAAETLTARELARAIDARRHFPARLLVVRERIGSLVFYLDAARRRELTPARVSVVQPRELRSASVPEGTLVAVPSKEVGRVERIVALGGIPFEAAGRYRIYEAAALGMRTSNEALR